MAATVIFATLLLCLSSNVEPLDQIEPLFVEEVETATDAKPAAVESTPLDRETETTQPVEQDAKAVDAVAPAIETNSIISGEPELGHRPRWLVRPECECLLQPQAAGETVVTPNADTTEPIGQNPEPVDVVPSVIVEDVMIANDATTIADPQPEAVEPIVVQNAGIIPDPRPEAIQETVVSPPVESTEPVEQAAEPLDTVEPIVVQNTEIIPDPRPEAIAETVVSPSVESAEPVEYDAEPLDTVEPIVVENTEIITDPQPEAVEMPVSEPAATTAAPVAEPPQVVEPAIVEDASCWCRGVNNPGYAPIK